MSAPREILPGRSYLLTRRCSQREFLLKPSRRTNQLVRYCLAVAAAKTRMLLHAACFMSNHWHGVVTDPFARLREFEAEQHTGERGLVSDEARVAGRRCQEPAAYRRHQRPSKLILSSAELSRSATP